MGFWLRHIDLIVFVAVSAAVPVLAVSAWIRYLAGRRKGKSPGRRWPRWLLTGLLALELACGLYGVLLEPRWLEVSRQRLSLPGLEGSLRVVQLSDLHLDGDGTWQAQIVAAVEAAEPDLIMLTGDYLNHPSHGPEFKKFLDHLVDLVGPQRILAVTGNFELIDKVDDLFADAGVSLLDGVIVTITRGGASLQVAGIGYHLPQIDEQYLAELASRIEPSVPAMLLTHTPDLAESEGIEAFDFVFCGHTHGGQVRLPFYGALITLSRFGKKYEAGLYRLGPGTRMYVSRGIGNEPAPAPRVRFLCRPEVAVFDFVPGD